MTMQHIGTIIENEGWLVDARTQVIGIDGHKTSEHLRQAPTDGVLEAVADLADGDASPDGVVFDHVAWLAPRGVVINPVTGNIEEVVILDPRCDFYPIEQPEA